MRWETYPGQGIRRTGSRGRRNLSAIRDSDYFATLVDLGGDDGAVRDDDLVVVVVFDDDFRLTTALAIPREIVEDMFPIRPYVDGRIITVTDALAMRTGITTIDMTAMTAAYQRIGALKSEITEERSAHH